MNTPEENLRVAPPATKSSMARRFFSGAIEYSKNNRPTQRIATSLRRPIVVSGRFYGDLLPTRARLGPLNLRQLLAKHLRQTVLPRPYPPRQPPNGVAWRFPDWKAVGFRLAAKEGLAVNKDGPAIPRFRSRTHS